MQLVSRSTPPQSWPNGPWTSAWQETPCALTFGTMGMPANTNKRLILMGDSFLHEGQTSINLNCTPCHSSVHLHRLARPAVARTQTSHQLNAAAAKVMQMHPDRRRAPGSCLMCYALTKLTREASGTGLHATILVLHTARDTTELKLWQFHSSIALL